MTAFDVRPTSYGYAVAWGKESTGDSTAMVSIDRQNTLVCHRCASATCDHVQAAIDHRATEKR